MTDINKAINKTITEVPDLSKSARNKHGGFNYVSIDSYYQEVAKVAAKNGLSWSVRETGCDYAGAVKTRNGEQMVYKFTYEFDVACGSSTHRGYSSFSVIHPYQGPQTAGSAASYADKLFMRTTFKVVTGEEDADAVDTTLNMVDKNNPPKPTLKKMSKAANEVVDNINELVKQKNIQGVVDLYMEVKADGKLPQDELDSITPLYTEAVRSLSQEATELTL